MNVQKLDGALASSISEDNAVRVSVFVRVASPLGEEARHALESYGVRCEADATVVPADLDAGQVAELSDRDWVVSIRLARKSRMLG